MQFLALAEIIGGFVAIVGVGWLLRRTGILAADDARPINALIIYVGLPALIFRAVHPAQLGTELAVVALIAWIVFTATALVAWVLSRALGLSRAVAGGFILTAALGNTGYIGYPVSAAVLGDDGLVRAIFYDIFGTVAALLVVGLFIAQRMGSADGPGVNPIKEVLTFPAVIALGAALVLRPVTIPPLVNDGIEALASLVVPLIMISVGLSLKPRSVREHAAPLTAAAIVKLLFAPLVALLVAPLMLSSSEAIHLVVLQAGMPAMMLSLVIGARFELDTDFIASAILVTTVLSVVTIPLMQVMAG